MGKVTFEDAFVLQRILRANDGIELMEQRFREVENINLKWGVGTTIVHFYISNANGIHESAAGILRMFKRVGADLEAKTKEGKTPLHFAISTRNIEITRELIKLGVSVDAVDGSGSTALFRAVMAYRGEVAYLELIRILVASGADIDQKNNFGHSPRSMVQRIHASIELVPSQKAWDLQPHLNW